MAKLPTKKAKKTVSGYISKKNRNFTPVERKCARMLAAARRRRTYALYEDIIDELINEHELRPWEGLQYMRHNAGASFLDEGQACALWFYNWGSGRANWSTRRTACSNFEDALNRERHVLPSELWFNNKKNPKEDY